MTDHSVEAAVEEAGVEDAAAEVAAEETAVEGAAVEINLKKDIKMIRVDQCLPAIGASEGPMGEDQIRSNHDGLLAALKKDVEKKIVKTPAAVVFAIVFLSFYPG